MKHNIFYFIAITISVCIITSCSHKSEIDIQLSKVENILSQNPDSALLILESIDPTLIDNEISAANYGCVNAQVRLINGKTIANDLYLDRSIAHYFKNNDSINLSKAYQLASIRSMHRLNQDSSIYYLEQAVKVIPKNNKTAKVQLLTELSRLLSKPSMRKDYLKALNYSYQAYNISEKPEDKACALHDVGLLYSFMENNDSCLSNIERSINLIHPDNPAFTSYALNYANTPGADPVKSKQYLSSINNNSLGKHITLGFLFINTGRIDSAYIEMYKADSLYIINPTKYSINTFNNLRLLKECLNFIRYKSVTPSDGVITNDSISEILHLEQRLSNERLETNTRLKTDLLKQRIKLQQTIMWLLFLVLTSSIIIFYVYYRWQQRYKKLQQEIDRERVSQIVIEASESPIDIDTIQAIILKRMQLCLTRFRDTGLYSRLRKIEIERDCETYLPLKLRENIQEKLLENFSDFIIDLKNDSSKLNIEDIMLCLLSLLKLNIKTISRCMGVSEGSIRTRKSRLKGKLSPFMFNSIFCEVNN